MRSSNKQGKGGATAVGTTSQTIKRPSTTKSTSATNSHAKSQTEGEASVQGLGAPVTEEFEHDKKARKEESQKVASLEGTLSEKDRRIKDLEAKISSLLENSTRDVKEISTLQSSLVDMTKECEVLKSAKLDAEKMRDLLRSEKIAISNLRQSKHDSEQNYESRIASLISEQNTVLERFKMSDSGSINNSAQVSEIFELNERLSIEVNDWKSACENVTARLQAEVSSMGALQKKLESTEKSRDFFQQQLAHVQNLYVDSKDEIHRVAIQLGESDSLNIRYRKELARCKDRVDELESAIRDANESHSLVKQLDLLRNQFNDLKKHMIQREMDVESGASKQRITLQIEHQGRSVYEKIIKELRHDLDESSTKLQDANFQLEKALQRCIRLEQLESEVILYKEAAKRAVEESQQVINSATASAEQKFESENEWEALSRELNGLKNELVTTQMEAKRLKDELEEERRKSRNHSLEIMTLERKIAEFGSSKIESETLMAEIRRKKVTDAYEIENLKRSLQEGQATVNGLRQQLSAVGDVEAKYDSLRQELLSVKSEAASKENDLKREISVLKDCEMALRKEIQVLKENVVMLKEVHQSSVLEIERLYDEYNAYRFERENGSLSAMADERKIVELHVQALRSDLEKSISSLMSAESLQAVQEEKITRLSACLDKEKERSRYLSAELEGANDISHKLQQQVSVFKNLDVYSSSRNAASKGDGTKDFGHRLNHLSASSTILERARKKLLAKQAQI